MFKIKRLHIFVVKSFLGPLVVTFFICMFIFLLQSVWKYVEYLVGKGLGLADLGELFYYLSLSVLPMALPLAILLAALMAFGNMGEHLELLAIKAAGVSLFRIMRPLIFFIGIVCIGAFYFSNHVLPWANNRVQSMMYNIKQKTPELEIEENRFVELDGGMVIKVKRKNKETGMLYDLLLYNHSKRKTYDNVTYADSAEIQMTPDGAYMKVSMYHGTTIEQFKGEGENTYNQERAPLRKDYFARRDVLFELDQGLKQDLVFSKHYISMSIDELKVEADTLQKEMKGMEEGFEKTAKGRYKVFKEEPVYGYGSQHVGYPDKNSEVKLEEVVPEEYIEDMKQEQQELVKVLAVSADSLKYSLKKEELVKALDSEIADLRRNIQEAKSNKQIMAHKKGLIRRMISEWHRKFSLSFSCLIFFFIGAPLGAIIRKGGLGLPVVISVLLFVLYYIIDTTGTQFAREGVMQEYIGMWLSSFFLLPLGVFLTFKAVTDSVMMSTDTYKLFFKKIFKRGNKNE